jgi:hypothetical protein
MAISFPNQIDNRNFLSPAGFKFSLAKEPKAAFFCSAIKIPEINLAVTIQPSYLKDIDVPGEKLTYGDLRIKFLIDENLENYMSIHNWLTGLGFPETAQDYKDLIINDQGLVDTKEAFSDGTLTILNSNYRSVAMVKFKDLFPVSLTSMEFDASITDVQYFTAEATFKYTVYNILGTDNKPL